MYTYVFYSFLYIVSFGIPPTEATAASARCLPSWSGEKMYKNQTKNKNKNKSKNHPTKWLFCRDGGAIICTHIHTYVRTLAHVIQLPDKQIESQKPTRCLQQKTHTHIWTNIHTHTQSDRQGGIVITDKPRCSHSHHHRRCRLLRHSVCPARKI